MRWAIVADDLTGAADAAVAFADNGAPTVVHLSFPPNLPEGTCIALDADVRWRSEGSTRQRIHRFVQSVRDADWVLLKVDSTLRGFVGAMVTAAMEAWGRKSVIFAPAVPSQGRLVKDGILFVRGQPLTETTFASEPPAPASSSVVAIRLQETGLRRFSIAFLPLTVVRDEKRLNVTLREMQADRKVVVSDAVTESDLECLVRAVMGLPERPLLVGASGLATALARVWLGTSVKQPKLPLPMRLLVLTASRQPATEEQLAMLQAKGVPVLEEPFPHLPLLPEAPIIAMRWRLPDEGWKPALLRRQMVARLRWWLPKTKVEALVLVGGFMARTALEALGICQWQLWGSLLPGVPCSVAQNREGQQWVVVTKAGGFGTPQTLWQLLALLGSH